MSGQDKGSQDSPPAERTTPLGYKQTDVKQIEVECSNCSDKCMITPAALIGEILRYTIQNQFYVDERLGCDSHEAD